MAIQFSAPKFFFFFFKLRNQNVIAVAKLSAHSSLTSVGRISEGNVVYSAAFMTKNLKGFALSPTMCFFLFFKTYL